MIARPSNRGSAGSRSSPSSATSVGVTSTLLTGVRTVAPRLKSAPQARKGVAHGPWAHTAVIAAATRERPGGAGIGHIGAGHAERIRRRTPGESQDDVRAALGMGEVDQFEGESAG